MVYNWWIELAECSASTPDQFSKNQQRQAIRKHIPTLPIACRNDSEASCSCKDPYREFDERPPAQAMKIIVLHNAPPEASRRRRSGAQFPILPESEKKHNHP
jgi:hypothetical protein